RPAPQPFSEREAPGESCAAAPKRQPPRLADLTTMRLRFGELLSPAVPRALWNVPPPVPIVQAGQGTAQTDHDQRIGARASRPQSSGVPPGDYGSRSDETSDRCGRDVRSPLMS